jgi:nitroreductase
MSSSTVSIAPAELLEGLRWRYATKKFDAARKIAPELWKSLEEALHLAPSSYGLQPWKFLVVTDPAVRAKLRPVSWNQPQITDASHLVVFCVRKDLSARDVERYIESIAQTRGVPAESLGAFKKMMLGSVDGAAKGSYLNEWNTRQVYIALGFFLTSCAVLGVDACPMEGFLADEYDKILGLPAQGYHAVVLATAGYRADDDAAASLKKVRFPSSEVISRV